MTEPEYTYVRGQGWIIQNLESLDFQDTHGKQWTLVARKPAIGEYGTFSDINNQFYVKDGKPNLQGWSNYFQYGVEGKIVDQQVYNHAYETEINRGWTCIWVTVLPR